MERTRVDQLKSKVGKKVLVEGWVHEIRSQSKVKFLILREETGLIQTIATPNKKFFENIAKIPRESVISIEGVLKEMKQAPNGIEIEIENYKVLSEAESIPIPVVEKGTSEVTLPKRLDWRCLDLRKPKEHAIFKIQAALIEGMEDYLKKEGYIQVFTPCLMGVPSESGSELFELKYFDTKAFLRQDPQLHRQLTIASGFEKIYDLGPSWRAELSHTTKHMCEHRTCAVEFAFLKDERDTMRVEEQLVVSAIKNVIKKCKKELELFGVDLKVPKTPFPELILPEVYKLLKKKGRDITGEDPDAEAEKIIWEYVQEKYKTDFYFFNRFPFKLKPFYVMRVDEDPEHARSVDLYCRGLELSSGGQREHRYDKIIEQVKIKKMHLQSVEWFTKFFKYGVPPHGGFALGIERLTQILLNVPNIREATLFPRGPERLVP